MELSAWQNKINTWANATFDHNEEGIANHLLREAVELCFGAHMSPNEIRAAVQLAIDKMYTKGLQADITEETADVTILALAMAGYMGFDLETSVEAKHAVNLARTWGKPDAQGVTEHEEANQ